MALVTVQRSPSVSNSPQSSDSGAGAPADDDEAARSCKSLSECYFAGKGAALVLPPNERARPSRRVSAAGCDIQQHLQSMFYLLRPEETLKMAVKLESVHPGRTRYLVVVSCTGRQDAEESCLLGIDCHTRATVGLVLRVLADTAITLDGDGGFSVSVCGSQHIFKPVSVQAMWSALQTLHKVSSKAREQNYFLGGLSHDWVSYYEQRIESDRSCLNEWHAMDNLESRRPPSPDSVRTKPRERDETERVIRSTLKEIMMSVDLDEVTSKYIRGRLEEDLDMDLGEFKPFIDQEMLTILGQMDAPTEIFDHVYLGSEWNASNLEELQKNGVRHILNVTREIDNFFPGMFTYLNVRVYDDEKTDLLKHWDDTFKYITKAKKEGSKVLVHCKMGVSRSASVVIAYAMKAYNWDFSQAWKHVKEKRNCIKPNNSFLLQLETYQGILDAMKNKEKLQRSKSDTNLKSPTSPKDGGSLKKEEKSGNRGDDDEEDGLRGAEFSGSELKKTGQRPKSWSPNVKISETMLPSVPLSQSLESIDKAGGGSAEVTREDLLRARVGGGRKGGAGGSQEGRNVLMPCDNGQSYSVSQNKIVHLPGPLPPPPLPAPDRGVGGAGKNVKNRVNELESETQHRSGQRRKGLVLNLTNQFESVSSKPSSPSSDPEEPRKTTHVSPLTALSNENGFVVQQNSSSLPSSSSSSSASSSSSSSEASSNAVAKQNLWDHPRDSRRRTDENRGNNGECLVWTACGSGSGGGNSGGGNSGGGSGDDDGGGGGDVKTNGEASECIATTTTTSTATTTMTTTAAISATLPRRSKREGGDPFSAHVDRVFEREERQGEQASGVTAATTTTTTTTRDSPSRQSSWSSYDSAVVLENNNSVHSSWATLPSRNSSWGSYDMRPSDLLGSSGLFPYDKEDIPWHPGTVKRTKQKLEEGNASSNNVKRVCTQNSDGAEEESYNPPVLLHHAASPTPPRRRDSSPGGSSGHNNNNRNSKMVDPLVVVRNCPSPARGIDISPSSSSSSSSSMIRQVGRLSTSAPAPSSLSSDSDLPSSLRSCRSESETSSSPCVVNTTQCPSVKHHKMVLENLNNINNNTTNQKLMFNKQRCLSVDDSPIETECPRTNAANVAAITVTSAVTTAATTISGLVKNLKKEFEAKSSKLEKSPESGNSFENDSSPIVSYPSSSSSSSSMVVIGGSGCGGCGGGGSGGSSGGGSGRGTKRDAKIRSLPSSPVIPHDESKIQAPPETKEKKGREGGGGKESADTQQENSEDRSVRVLVGKYEVGKPDSRKSTEIQLRVHRDKDWESIDSQQQQQQQQRHGKSSRIMAEYSRRSAPILINNHSSSSSSSSSSPLFGETAPEAPGRPPVPSAGTGSTGSKKQQQQHGRTHPLARLQVRPRHSSPVYNTM